MKKFLLKQVFVFSLTILSFSCSEKINFDMDMERRPEDVARNYVQSILMKDNMVHSRNLLSEEEYPEVLTSLSMTDENGNKISFLDLDDEKKKEFFEFWKEDYTNEISKKLNENENFLKMLAIENEAFYETVNDVGRNMEVKSLSNFFNKYENNLQQIIKRVEREDIKSRSGGASSSGSSNGASSSGSSNGSSAGSSSGSSNGSSSGSSASSGGVLINVSKCNLVDSSVEIFKKNYKKGRILINTCNSSSGSSGYIGHASLMKGNFLTIDVDDSKNSKATITSFPYQPTKGTTWKGQIDGVQYEPIGYWCGDNAAPTVSILQVQNTWWSWFLRKNHTEASEASASMAIENAENNLGKKYNSNFMFFGMWDTSSFYCSSLVFRAWLDVSSEYSLNTNPIWVAPSDLYASENTRVVTSYRNF